MPTAKPRIQVTLTVPQYELLQRLAKLQHRSMSAVVAELWESIHPVLERVAVALQAATRAQESAREGLRRSVDQTERELRPHVAAALGQLDLLTMDLDKQVGAAPDRDASAASTPAGASPTPVPVTRGSGRRTLRRSKPRALPPRKAKPAKRGARR